MPLEKGSSKEVISRNIAELIRAGHKPDQAAAIAYKEAGEAKDEYSVIRAAGIMFMDGSRVLLLKRVKSAGAYPATWAFPGGKIEEGETPEECARRETMEETQHVTKSILHQIDFTQRDGVEFTTFVCSGEFFNPSLNDEHCGYVWADINGQLPEPLHPGCAATIAQYAKSYAMDSARQQDINGFTLIEANPISRSGVFQYLGKHLPGAEDKNRVYNVYRPAEELADQDAIDSFKLLPIVDDHEMLGDAEKGYTPAENKGVHGSTGDKIFFKDGVLYSNLKIFSQTLTDMVQSGKRDLSLGYRCVYEKVSGVFNGEPYQYIQRKLRGNHLALVDDARCDVQVLDQHIAFDSVDLALETKETKMADEKEKDKDMKASDKAKDSKAKDSAETEMGEGESESKEPSLKEVHDFMKSVMPMMAKINAMLEKHGGMKEEEEEEATDPAADGDTCLTKDKAKDDADFNPTKTPAKTGNGKGVTDEAEKEKEKGMDMKAMDSAIERKVKQVITQTRKEAIREIADRDSLANQLSGFIGTFDASDKTVDEVAAYGVEKLGLKCDKGQERAALTGFLHNRKPSGVGFAMDGMGGEGKSGKFAKFKAGA